MKISSNLLILGVIAALIVGGAYAVTLALASPAAQQAATGTPGTGTPMATRMTQERPTPAPVNLVRAWSSMCVEGVPYTLLSVPLDAKFALVIPQASVSTNGTAVPVTGGLQLPSGTVIPANGTSAPASTSFVGGTAAPTETMTPQATTGTGTPQASNGTAIVPVTGANSSNKGTLGQIPTQNACTAMGTMSGLQLVMCTGPEGNHYILYVHNASGTQAYQGTLWDCAKANKNTSPAAANTTALTLPAGTTAATMPPTLPPTLPPATLPPTTAPATPTP